MDNVAHVWVKKYVYMLLLGYLKCHGDFGVDEEGRELRKSVRRNRIGVVD